MRASSDVAVVVAQLVVLLALGRFHLAENRLLRLRRQLRGDLLLGAAQDERPQRRASSRRVSVVRIARQSAASLKTAGGAQHAGIEELEQAPQLAQVILDRCAAERQPMVARAAAAPPWPIRVAAFLIACASSSTT